MINKTIDIDDNPTAVYDAVGLSFTLVWQPGAPCLIRHKTLAQRHLEVRVLRKNMLKKTARETITTDQYTELPRNDLFLSYTINN